MTFNVFRVDTESSVDYLESLWEISSATHAEAQSISDVGLDVAGALEEAALAGTLPEEGVAPDEPSAARDLEVGRVVAALARDERRGMLEMVTDGQFFVATIGFEGRNSLFAGQRNKKHIQICSAQKYRRLLSFGMWHEQHSKTSGN